MFLRTFLSVWFIWLHKNYLPHRWVHMYSINMHVWHTAYLYQTWALVWKNSFNFSASKLNHHSGRKSCKIIFVRILWCHAFSYKVKFFTCWVIQKGVCVSEKWLCNDKKTLIECKKVKVTHLCLVFFKKPLTIQSYQRFNK